MGDKKRDKPFKSTTQRRFFKTLGHLAYVIPVITTFAISSDVINAEAVVDVTTVETAERKKPKKPKKPKKDEEPPPPPPKAR